jgi:molybdopterin/thiamine biosynthesis adenylyltransferase
MDTILVPAAPEPYPRIPGNLTEALREKTVTIAGLGSGGGDIALNLACAGLGRLIFFDYDRLHPENYVRHALTKRDLGRLKTEGITDAIKERDLPTEVLAAGKGVIVWADEFRDSLKANRPDVMVCATDSRESRRFMNLCSIAFKIPLVIAGFLGAGRIGEVILVRPGVSACYECIRLELGAALEVPETEGLPPTPYLGSEEVDLLSAVQRFDIGFLSSLVTRAALQLLDPKAYPPLPTDYLVWGREALNEYAPQFSFDLPLTLNYVPVPRRGDCPACGANPADLEGIDIDGKYSEILVSLGSLPA